jgi:polyketide-type polyunsaturated fatty acid synthase PfaA
MKAFSQARPIAVVGASAIFPGSPDAGRFWRNILEGKDLITDVPPTHWLISDYYDPDPAAPDKTYCKRGAFLSPVDFDALEFGIPPKAIPATDTSQLLALIAARRVLDDAAATQFDKVARDRISVILGVASGTELLGHMVSRLQRPIWQKALRDSGFSEEQVQRACDRIADQFVPWQESTFPGLLGNVVAGRIANRLDLGGTNCVVDAACASSLSAISMAVNELYLGQSDLAIVGGVDTINDIFMYMCFSKTPALSRTGDCRPFSSKADGTMLGEGLALMALRRLDDAERDGDAVYAVLKGIGASSDGKSKSIYAPVSAGQGKALRRAYEAAGYGPETVGLMEAHGTATIAGDAVEFAALREVFEAAALAKDSKERQWCALGSLKSQIGHTKAAAGAAGLFKVVMALHHRVLPPTIKVDEPNPELDLENSPFYLNTVMRPWIAHSDHPRRASVSSFGFGGSNFHLTLEEYCGPSVRPGRYRSSATELFLFSGSNAAELAENCGGLSVAEAAHFPFDANHPVRLAIVSSGPEDLRTKLERVAGRLSRAEDASDFEDPSGIYFHAGKPLSQVACLFPGQGSQYAGMTNDLACEFDIVREVWDRVPSLAKVVFPTPGFSEAERNENEQRLRATEWAQPAIGMASLAYLKILAALGVKPISVAGHSFGELTALHAARVLDEESFIHLAFGRGRLMSEAAAGSAGTMTAVLSSSEAVQRYLREFGGDEVVLANINEPGQAVVSGTLPAIERFEAFLSAKSVDYTRLRVSTAFHSPIVAGAGRAFHELLGEIQFQPGVIPVYSNSEAEPYPFEDLHVCRKILSGQIAAPVRFAEQIHAMYEGGARVFVEVGPGTTLTHLARKCLQGLPHETVSLDRKGMNGVAGLFHGLARLAVAGVSLDLRRLFSEFRPNSEPPRSKSSAAVFPVSGVNYGKPYPGLGPGAAEVQRKVQTQAEIESNAQVQVSHIPSQGVSVSQNVDPNSWLSVYLELQRQTAEAHQAFQRAMTESHSAYLRTMEVLFAGLTGSSPPASAPTVSMPLPASPTQPMTMPAPMPAPVPAPVSMPAAPPLVPRQIPKPHASAQKPVPSQTPADVPLEQLKNEMLQVVAEKTGYPLEILDLKMDMEADLGIDSIKRVEILSAFRERVPGLPEVKGKDMARLRTLAEVVEFMEAACNSGRLLRRGV